MREHLVVELDSAMRWFETTCFFLVNVKPGAVEFSIRARRMRACAIVYVQAARAQSLKLGRHVGFGRLRKRPECFESRLHTSCDCFAQGRGERALARRHGPNGALAVDGSVRKIAMWVGDVPMKTDF
jgi:hypothetical protein